MRIIFAGTPPFAAAALDAIVAAGHHVALVLTQPDRPSGRGMKQSETAVATVAKRHHLRVEKPISLKTAEIQALLIEQEADVMVVAAYGLLLPAPVLGIPRKGCINIHASLLPRWRGAAPIQRAIEAGDAVTGISIMQMDVGLDTGAVLLEKQISIATDDSSASLFDKLATLGAEAIVDALANLDSLFATPQSDEGVTYARKILKSESPIDWTQPAIVLERRMRAFDPFPGCEAVLDGEKLKLWRGTVVEMEPGSVPGGVMSAGNGQLVIQCGEGQLRIDLLQRPGGRRMTAAEFLRGTAVSVGSVFA
ncbi:MAG: methionyl-tRNA formyltransferase [Betaproteobacteria bacterium]|nr:methionyl-tRNA formyltransferase [Betaproteobacteria bacterium]